MIAALSALACAALLSCSRTDHSPQTPSTAAQQLTAGDDVFSTLRWRALVLTAEDLLANDPPGVTLVSVEQPSALGATRMETTEGLTRVVWFMPANYAWPEGVSTLQSQFQYRIRNSAGEEALGTVTVQVADDSPGSQIPRVLDDAATTDWDTALELDVMANDVRQPAAGTHIVIGTDVTGTRGRVSLTAHDTRIRYEPAVGFTGTDTFLYSLGYSCACEPSDDCDQVCHESSVWAVVTVTVTEGARQPGAGSDAYSVGEGDALDVPAPGVLSNDRSPENRPMTAELVTPPAHGTVQLSPDGAFSYRPAPGYSGADSFDYVARDDRGWSQPGTVAFTVRQNLPPVVADDAYTLAEDGVLVVAAPGLLANDSDPEGERLVAILAQPPMHGTATINEDGSFTYRPAANFNGVDAFIYEARDQRGRSKQATVSVTITPVHDGVVATGDAYTTSEGNVLSIAAPGVLANDLLGDAASMVAEVVNPPVHGTLSLSHSGAFVYTPVAGYSGPDAFVYRASDGVATSDATVSLTVQPANAAPVTVADTYNGSGGHAIVVPAPGVLGNDTNPRDGALTVTVSRAPQNGVLQLGSDGGFTYTPNPGFYGSDNFVYTASNGTWQSSGTVTLSIARNDAPTLVANTFSAVEDTKLDVASPGVLGGALDPEGDPLTAHLVQGPARGAVTLRTDGSFSYTPAANYHGSDSFTFEARDGQGNTARGTASIQVASVFDGAAAVADAYTVAEDGTLRVAAPGVLGNDARGDSTSLTAALASGPSHGTLELSADGSFVYQPAANYSGADAFTYTAQDSNGGRTSATVTLTVSPVNDAPVSAPDAYSTFDGQALVVAAPGVLANDSDAERQTLSAVITSPPSGGTVSLAADGSFVYTPNVGFHGADGFSYYARDPLGSTSSSVRVTITVTLRAPVGLVLDDDARADMSSYVGTMGRKQSTRRSTLLLSDFAFNEGASLLVSTGWLGDEAFYALKVPPGGTFPRRRCARVNDWATDDIDDDRDYHFGTMTRVRNTTPCSTPQVGTDYAERVYANSNKGRNDCRTGSNQHSYESVRDVTPLRATSLKALVGRRVCAVVLGGRIHVNYGVLSADLRGENLGTVAFRVTSVTLNSSTPRTLPDMRIQILPLAGTCSAGGFDRFMDAPVPTSPSDPWDVAP